jgi:hypothetical protein
MAIMHFSTGNGNDTNNKNTSTRVTFPNGMDEDFCYWFLGFVEGDGSFSVNQKDANYLSFKIRQKGRNTLDYIQTNLGFGKVTEADDGYFNFSVNNQSEVLILLNMFNGNFFFSHSNDKLVSQFINPWNERYSDNTVTYLGKGHLPSFNNAWLCGFTDGNGSFGFSIPKDLSPTNKRLKMYFYLDQSDYDGLLEIKHILDLGRIEPKKTSITSIKQNKQPFRYIITNKRELLIILDYFKKYPLKTNKKERYDRLLQAIEYHSSGTLLENEPILREMIKLNSVKGGKSINK